jgi:type II secretory pathway pseudopilin PulG
LLDAGVENRESTLSKARTFMTTTTHFKRIEFSCGDAAANQRSRGSSPPTALIMNKQIHAENERKETSMKMVWVGDGSFGMAGFAGLRTRKRQRTAALQDASRIRGSWGYTLIEVVGVMAVIAILVAIMAPSMIQRIDRAAQERDAADLKTISDALVQGILRNQTVPSETTWVQVVANELAQAPNHISANARGRQRVYLIDPSLRLGAPNGTLPYTQTTNGSIRPASPRLMILSSLSATVPVASGMPTQAQFNNIWNAAEGTVPEGWTSWGGRADDLNVERVNLDPLFHRLILNNVDQNGTPSVSLDGSGLIAVSTNNPSLDRYYLEGTVVGLHATNQLVDVRAILQRDISYVFELNFWRGGIYDGQDRRKTEGMEFNELVEEFLSLPRNPNAKFGSTQQAVIDEMFTYMFVYALWADTCFDRYGSQNLQQIPQYISLGEAQKRLADVQRSVTKNLID